MRAARARPEASFLLLLDLPRGRREMPAGLYELTAIEPGELLPRIRAQVEA